MPLLKSDAHYDQTLFTACRLFGPSGGHDWIRAPSHRLGGVSPAELLRTGREDHAATVAGLLYALEVLGPRCA